MLYFHLNVLYFHVNVVYTESNLWCNIFYSDGSNSLEFQISGLLPDPFNFPTERCRSRKYAIAREKLNKGRRQSIFSCKPPWSLFLRFFWHGEKISLETMCSKDLEGRGGVKYYSCLAADNLYYVVPFLTQIPSLSVNMEIKLHILLTVCAIFKTVFCCDWKAIFISFETLQIFFLPKGRQWKL